MTITDSIISGNSADDSGGGLYISEADVTIERSLISDNFSNGEGGGLYYESTGPVINIQNSTFSGNVANESGGGIHNDVGLMLLDFVTITNNTADADASGASGDGGGLSSPGTVVVKNTIIAGNFDSSSAPDCTGDGASDITSFGNNWIGNDEGCAAFYDADLSDTIGTMLAPEDPMLGPLQDNGGPDVGTGEDAQPLLSHALLPGSGAIDDVAAADCTNIAAVDVTEDQRGATRPANTDCDIGAVEVQDVCGDSFLDGGEECDDGNTTAGDGCSASCEIEAGYECTEVPSLCVTVCGDGVVAGAEECDDGGDNSDTEPDACRTDCTAASCGDGVVDTDEECDDGNDVDDDDCSNECVDQSGGADGGDGDGDGDGGGCSLTAATSPSGQAAPVLWLGVAGILMLLFRRRSRALVIAGLLAFSLTTTTVNAAMITVNETQDELNDDGDCSLREAIKSANEDVAFDACTAGSGDDEVSIPDGVYRLTLSGSGEDAADTGDLDITEGVTINGTSIGGTIIDGNHADRIFDVDPAMMMSFDVTITDVTIQNGTDVDGSDGGGGILNRGTLQLNDVAIVGNIAPSDGGGINNVTGASLTASNARIEQNSALDGADGGGIYSDGSLSISQSEIIANFADVEGGGVNCGGGSTLCEIQDTRVADNISLGDGGGLKLAGDGSAISNCLVSNNFSADSGGGIRNSGGGTAVHSIDETIIDGNIADDGGGGIYQQGSAGIMTTITDSIISNNVSLNDDVTLESISLTQLISNVCFVDR